MAVIGEGEECARRVEQATGATAVLRSGKRLCRLVEVDILGPDRLEVVQRAAEEMERRIDKRCQGT